MLRAKLKDQHPKNSANQFRFRGTDNTRIEALSDGVFAIATALLIISSSIPETYNELIIFLDDLVPFATCIAMLILIWFQHYVFFIRYGFKDAKIVAINTLLLFLILFYVYPLKFLFKLLYQMFSAIFAQDQDKMTYLFTEVMPMSETPDLMVIYGAGLAGIFCTLAFMYYLAYRRRDSIDLNQIEIFDTLTSMKSNLIMALIPVLSVLISFFRIGGVDSFIYSGFLYWTFAVVMPTFGMVMKKKRKALIEYQNE